MSKIHQKTVYHVMSRTALDGFPFKDAEKDEFDENEKNKGILHYRKKWSSLSKFMQEIKQTFSKYYNKRHHRKGTLWGSVLKG